ncbi:DUF4097 family beta strand repeat-containing protein [Parapedobacter koreensis]|uniref:DUF4097 and DUF4098 domain-containing protein YvlB n=1 Tax=Parapedobacter koreensis TaxID=332977 RepID=A0A1H7FA98_9SPHI|nr:DUF4097 family beta strand repeat-containing protein [Parapedobacter koreensis]SEK22267.1 DUF4097 and DUF4098 domain-containing protein YvlB [Parapedobacter koreensis]
MYKRSLTLGFFILLLTNSWAQQDQVLFTTEKFPANSIRQVDVVTGGGQITISGSATNEASVEVFLRANNRAGERSPEELTARFKKEYDFELAVQNGTLKAYAKRKNGLRGNQSLSVSFNIVVPEKADTKLHTGGGSIKLERLAGTQSFKTGGGSLQFSGIKGIIDGETGGGSIAATDCEGTLKIVTGGGSFDLENLSGTIDIRTGGGSIKGTQLAGTLTSNTGGGSIQLTDLACELDVNTGGGSISASLVKTSGPISLKTGAGSINVELPTNGGYDVDLRGSRVNTKNLRNFSGSQKKDELRGQVNGGGVALTASTGSGSVNVSF